MRILCIVFTLMGLMACNGQDTSDTLVSIAQDGIDEEVALDGGAGRGTNDLEGCDVQPIVSTEQRMGCGCNYWQPDNESFKPLLQANLEFTEAAMKLKGQLVALTIEDAKPIPVSAQEGESFVQHFSYDGQQILLEAIIQTTCTPEEINCEVVGLSGKLTVIGPQCQSVFENLAGDCGC